LVPGPLRIQTYRTSGVSNTFAVTSFALAVGAVTADPAITSNRLIQSVISRLALLALLIAILLVLSFVSLLIGTLMCFMTSSLCQVVVPECTPSALLEPYETK